MSRGPWKATIAIGLFLLSAIPLTAQQARVDVSACRGMYRVLEAMRDGAPREKVSAMLDALLETPPYQVMFKHYNRSWRPNHLPKSVFKKMILSLRFEGEYSLGENERADAMRKNWTKFYPDLSLYEKQLRQLEAADLRKLINDGVRYAQGWLPQGWKIPDFTFEVIPNGGSPAFAIENAQGYDFLQLAQKQPGEIDLNWLVGTVAHESHHLGMQLSVPGSLSTTQSIAFQVITLCIPEGTATEFISGPPEGRAPAAPGVPFHVLSTDLAKAWQERVGEEEEMVKRQTSQLD